MRCLVTVLQMIGFFFVGMVLITLVLGLIALVALGTQHLFGWPDWAGFSCFVIYSIVSLGTFVGVMECSA